MAVAINAGISAGGLAPTSLFGIVTNTTARQAGIDLNPFTLLAAATDRESGVARCRHMVVSRARAWPGAARNPQNRRRRPHAHDSRHLSS